MTSTLSFDSFTQNAVTYHVQFSKQSMPITIMLETNKYGNDKSNYFASKVL